MFDKLNKQYFYGEQRLVVKFLPKCHPELAEIERHWRWSKKVTKDENSFDWGIDRFRRLVQETLDKVPTQYFQNIHDEVIRFEQAYAVNDNVSGTFHFAKHRTKRDNYEVIVKKVDKLKTTTYRKRRPCPRVSTD